jgi:hypothetical protein
MIARSSGLVMRVGRFSKQLRGVGLLTMPDAGQDTMRRVKFVWVSPLGAGLLRMLVPGMAVEVIIDRRCLVDGVEVTR